MLYKIQSVLVSNAFEISERTSLCLPLDFYLETMGFWSIILLCKETG